jgi:hypothetical protein
MAVPHSVPPAPDGLLTLIRANHGTLTRVVIALNTGRDKYRTLNAIRIAAPGEKPGANAEQISNAVMSVATAHNQETDRPGRYRAQLLLQESANSEPKRRACHFELGELGDVADVADPGKADDVLISHITHCHGEIIRLAGVVSSLGEKALEREGTSIERLAAALELRADAQIELANNNTTASVEQAKITQNAQVIEMLKPAVEQAVLQFATRAGIAVNAAAKPAALPRATVSPLPVPSLLPQPPAAQGGAQELGQPAATVPASEAEGLPPELRGLPDLALVSQSFVRSFTAEQWLALVDVATKPELRALKAAAYVKTDAEAQAQAQELRGKLKPKTREALERTLDGDQVKMLMQLLTAPAGKESSDTSGTEED